MRASLVVALAAALAGSSVMAGCTDQGIGRQCLDPTDSDGGTLSGTLISSPALECRTRLCLLQPNNTAGSPNVDVCTARCNTNDDCNSGLISATATSGQCTTKFVCAVPSQTGPFACQTMCMCMDGYNAQTNGDSTASVGYGCPLSCMQGNGCVTASMVQE